MKLRPIIIPAFIMIAAFFGITYISCNKPAGAGQTTTKCISCSNGGACINDTCGCPVGWEGNTCGLLSAGKFIGEWTVTEKGSNSDSITYQIGINNNNSGDVTEVLIQGLYAYIFSAGAVVITANVNGDSIFIPSQQFPPQTIVGKGYFIKGGNEKANIIKMRYMVSDASTGIVNDFGYNNPADSPSVWVSPVLL